MGQGDSGVEEAGMNEGMSLRRALRTNEEHCERRTCAGTKAINEGASHERRKPTNEQSVTECLFAVACLCQIEHGIMTIYFKEFFDDGKDGES